MVIPPDEAEYAGPPGAQGPAAAQSSQAAWLESRWSPIGVLSTPGVTVIQSQFDNAFPFSEGLAVVVKDGRWGYLDKTGRLAIPPRFDSAKAFSEGLGRVLFNEKWGYVNYRGKLAIPHRFAGLTIFRKGSRQWKWMGNMVSSTSPARLSSPRQYHLARQFSEGLAVVYPDRDVCGFIDRLGKMVIPPHFPYAGNFKEGLAPVRK